MPPQRTSPREEPDAGNLHVRVCGGRGWQHPRLPGAKRRSRVPTLFITPKAPQRRAGFTLVEIIVALAILALSLDVILPAISDALWRTGEAEAQAEAASLGRSLLAQAGTAVPLNNGAAAGQFENGFRWRLEVTPYGSADQTMPLRAYKVVAEVFWDDARHERSVALTTLRLGANGAGR
jgi:general secretion pathway protein I